MYRLTSIRGAGFYEGSKSIARARFARNFYLSFCGRIRMNSRERHFWGWVNHGQKILNGTRLERELRENKNGWKKLREENSRNSHAWELKKKSHTPTKLLLRIIIPSSSPQSHLPGPTDCHRTLTAEVEKVFSNKVIRHTATKRARRRAAIDPCCPRRRLLPCRRRAGRSTSWGVAGSSQQWSAWRRQSPSQGATQTTTRLCLATVGGFYVTKRKKIMEKSWARGKI